MGNALINTNRTVTSAADRTCSQSLVGEQNGYRPRPTANAADGRTPVEHVADQLLNAARGSGAVRG